MDDFTVKKLCCFCSFLSLIMIPNAFVFGGGDDASSYVSTRATYYGSPDCFGTSTGACGYGEYGRTVNNGEVTGASKLYRNGTGCGACYQVIKLYRVFCSWYVNKRSFLIRFIVIESRKRYRF